jgi:hypothetical protein
MDGPVPPCVRTVAALRRKAGLLSPATRAAFRSQAATAGVAVVFDDEVHAYLADLWMTHPELISIAATQRHLRAARVVGIGRNDIRRAVARECYMREMGNHEGDECPFCKAGAGGVPPE